jgi:hypothetical protein
VLVENTDNPFPRRSDIETLLEDGNSKTILSALAGQGVFLLGKKKQIPKLITRFAFGEDFYKKAFSTLIKAAYGISISGVRSNIPESINLLELFQEEQGIYRPDHKYEPFVLNVTQKNEIINIKVQYTKLNARFADFRRRDTYQIDLQVKKVSDNTTEFRSYPKNTTDSLVARDIVHSILKRAHCDPLEMDLENLSIKSRVDLFDKILVSESGAEWRVEEVCGLTVRAGESDNPEENDLEDGSTELPEEKVRMLQSAILEGANLRDHKIVFDLLKDDFYFSAATAWVSKPGIKGSLTRYRIRIEFKKRPSVLVVNVSDCKTPDDVKEKWDYETVSDEIGKEVIQFFWNQVHSLFSEFVDKEKGSARKVVRKNDKS